MDESNAEKRWNRMGFRLKKAERRGGKGMGEESQSSLCKRGYRW
jgi:hypothetical protein